MLDEGAQRQGHAGVDAGGALGAAEDQHDGLGGVEAELFDGFVAGRRF
jgi:hypothetical protein